MAWNRNHLPHSLHASTTTIICTSTVPSPLGSSAQKVTTTALGNSPPPVRGRPRNYVGLAAAFSFFERIIQTRFLPLRFRDLCLNFLRGTASM